MRKKATIILSGIIIFLFIIPSGCRKADDKESLFVRKLEKTTESIAVGIFKGNGASSTCVQETMEAMKIDRGIVCVTLTAADIVRTELANIDVLVLPGGSGRTSINNIGEQGVELIKKFVKRKGKGLVGICAGAYMMTTTPEYPDLEIVDIKAIDIEHDNRGKGLVEFTLTEEGTQIFPELSGLDKLFVDYYEGPVLELNGDKDEYNVLSDMVSDVCQFGDAPSGLTPGKPVFINGKAGRGRVFLSVVHPESTPGMRWIVPRMVRWVAGKELISYEGNAVRPELFTSEILQTPETEKRAEELFMLLFNEDPKIQIEAIDELQQLRPWNAKKWVPGLLRDDNPEVRIRAAKFIADIEYTASIPDVETAIKLEKDDEVKAELKSSLHILNDLVEDRVIVK